MKKNIFLWLAAIILVVTAVYTVNNYKAGAGGGISPAKQEQQTEQSASDSNPADQSENDEQITGHQEQGRINLMDSFDFTLEDLDGNNVALSQFRGKKVFLNFWATWCPPCKAEMPDIEKLYQETKDTDLVILAVNVGEDKNTVKSFIEKNNYNFTVLLDVKGEVSQLYQVTGIPTSYFIDTKGYLDGGTTGSIPLESMKGYVDNLE
ncbi:MAG TPA: TlpA disulfide reductase family protein [Bacillota bacterium]|nr:TlpA disulfide reductase family protein [Bacillota bacterium]